MYLFGCFVLSSAVVSRRVNAKQTYSFVDRLFVCLALMKTELVAREPFTAVIGGE